MAVLLTRCCCSKASHHDVPPATRCVNGGRRDGLRKQAFSFSPSSSHFLWPTPLMSMWRSAGAAGLKAPSCRSSGGEGEKNVSAGGKEGEGEVASSSSNGRKGGGGGGGGGGLRPLETALARSFGRPVWFGVLSLTLALLVGSYLYLFSTFADFSDIPIFNGPSSSPSYIRKL